MSGEGNTALEQTKGLLETTGLAWGAVSSVRGATRGGEAFVAIVEDQAKGELKRYVYEPTKETIQQKIKSERVDGALFVASSGINGIGSFSIKLSEYQSDLKTERYGETVITTGGPQVVKNN